MLENLYAFLEFASGGGYSERQGAETRADRLRHIPEK
jgi:hypothetical protein